MDIIDHQIIKLLQDNGRISIKKMAEIISLTPPAVAERIRKLEETGVIKGYRAVIDPKKLGLNIKAIITIKLDPGKRNQFLEFAGKNDSIIECHHVIGGFSMIVKAVCKEIDDLEMLVGKIQQYGSTQTHVTLSSPIDYKRFI